MMADGEKPEKCSMEIDGRDRLSTSFHKFTHVFFKLQASDVDLVTYNTYKLNHVKT